MYDNLDRENPSAGKISIDLPPQMPHRCASLAHQNGERALCNMIPRDSVLKTNVRAGV